MSVSSSKTREIGRRIVPEKTLAGRCRKREDWMEYLHSILLIQFKRFTELKVEITLNILLNCALKELKKLD